MTIAEKGRGDKGLIPGFLDRLRHVPARRLLWAGIAVLGLVGCFGLGILYERDQNEQPKDPGFWIEQIPQASAAEVMPEPLPDTPASKKSKKTPVKKTVTLPVPLVVQTPLPAIPAAAATSVASTSAPPKSANPVAAEPMPAGGEVIASKGGSVYYLPWCSGVSRIKPENRVAYASKEAAEAKGLAPSKTCKGL